MWKFKTIKSNNMNVEILIPILISLGAFAMIVGLRYLASREKMAMIEKGMDPGMKKSRSISPFTTLKFGLVILGFGVGLLVAYFLDAFVLPHPEFVDSTAVYFGFIGLFGGLGLMISYVAEMRYRRKNNIID
jgi:hypothetical protein